ncbi:MAG TPA: dTDP-4-dehydrorhamnose reductase [Anaerolineaceae bacterium]|nr:dTDP-4-dehydrorhamnose reductase [Anaerolineaceae bacterium]
MATANTCCAWLKKPSGGSTMRILLFGKTGQLGWELQRTLPCLGEVTALDYPEVDFSHPESLRTVVRSAAPDVVINAVAYTNVDKAEIEPERCQLINATSVGVIAEESARSNATLIHYSTDYVFDGQKGSPYVEQDLPRPLSIYGQSKLDGEQAVQQVHVPAIILRTSWVYSMRQGGFVTKVLQWSRQQTTLRMVTDQVGNPTWARSLAEITAQMLARAGGDLDWLNQRRGLYHLGGSGFASRLEWAQAILENDPNAHEQTVTELLPALTADFPTPAVRPLFSAMNCDHFTRTFGLRLPPWQIALKLCTRLA